MKKNTVLMMAMAALMLLNATMGWAQGMSVNLTGTRPDTSAMLDVSATNKGLLLPRMTTAQRNAIPLPATGLLVYQTDGTAGYYYNAGTTSSPNWTAAVGMAAGSYTGQMQYWNGSAWVGLTTGTSGQVLTLSGGGLPQWTTPTSTGSITTAPVLSTNPISGIHTNSVTCGGNISSDGGASVTARGVCWSTSPNPTVLLTTKTTNGTGTGYYTSTITSLSNITTYYIRAYATNSVGTTYGAEVTVTTGTIPTLTTSSITAVTDDSVATGGSISNDGGLPVTARGICWSTSTGPTVSLLTKTTDGTGIGSFTSDGVGLVQATTYYVRAYATNSAGTAYGSELVFTTIPTIGYAMGGGIVGYVLRPSDYGYSITVPHGLIAKATDETPAQWYYYSTYISVSGGTNYSYGAGFANTTAIVSTHSSNARAAYNCRQLTTGGYTDWYLPSAQEMQNLLYNYVAIGGFTSPAYWTSTLTSGSSDAAYYGYFSGSGSGVGIYYNNITNTFALRAVRSF